MMDDQLRRRSVGSPAARSLLLTILGEFVLPLAGEVWQETLVVSLASIGYTEQAARQALSRSARDRWLQPVRRGRRARMFLTESGRDLLATGARRIYTFGEPWTWDRRWLIVILRVPEQRRAVRHQLRTRLAWAGLGSLGNGVWLTPHVERELELSAAIRDEPFAEARSFVAELGELGDARQLVAEAWDLKAVREQYGAFIDDFVQARPSSPEECFRQQTQLVHAWRRFPFLDPDLPEELLPGDWPRRPAHELFLDRHRAWTAGAVEYFTELDSSFGPAARAA